MHHQVQLTQKRIDLQDSLQVGLDPSGKIRSWITRKEKLQGNWVSSYPFTTVVMKGGGGGSMIKGQANGWIAR